MGRSSNADMVDYQSARAKREHYNAKLAELEYQKAVGQLVEIGLVREVILNATTTLRTQLEQMAERIAPQVLDAAGEGEIRAAILKEVEHTFLRPRAMRAGPTGHTFLDI